MVLAAGGGVIASMNADSESDGDAETTAWQDREHLNEVLAETARAAGIGGAIEPGPEGVMPCTRTDGRDGVFYRLTELVSDEPAGDVLAVVSQRWTDLGFAVQTSSPGVLTATTPEAGTLSLAASEVGMRLGGWTGCALEDGAPEGQ